MTVNALGLVVAILMIPAIAVSQTTRCTENAITGVVCRTTSDEARDCSVGGLSALSMGCTVGEVKQAKKASADRKAVGQLIADGKCDEAKNLALRAGDFDLAERTARICALAAR